MLTLEPKLNQQGLLVKRMMMEHRHHGHGSLRGDDRQQWLSGVVLFPIPTTRMHWLAQLYVHLCTLHTFLASALSFLLISKVCLIISHNLVADLQSPGTYAQVSTGVEGLVLFDIMTHTTAG